MIFSWLGCERSDSPAFEVRLRAVEAGDDDAADAAAIALAELGRRFGEEALGEQMLTEIGYDLLSRRAVDATLGVLTENSRRFPQSWNVWDSLAEAYASAGATDRAIALYEKSLALKPENESASAMIDRLRSLGEAAEE